VQHPRELPQSVQQHKIAMRLVFTTDVTYLEAHLLQKLLLTPLIREIVTKITENTEKKTFSKAYSLNLKRSTRENYLNLFSK